MRIEVKKTLSRYDVDIYMDGELVGSATNMGIYFIGYSIPFRTFPRDWIIVKHIKQWLKQKQETAKIFTSIDKKKLTFEKTHNRRTGNVYYDGELFLEIASGTGNYSWEVYVTYKGEIIKPLINTKKTTLRSLTLGMIDKNLKLLDDIESKLNGHIDGIYC